MLPRILPSKCVPHTPFVFTDRPTDLLEGSHYEQNVAAVVEAMAKILWCEATTESSKRRADDALKDQIAKKDTWS